MYKVTIGLEVHCELESNSKVFSPAKNEYTEEPNCNLAYQDLGFPGILPSLNEEAVKRALKVSMALNCKQPDEIIFDRKNYYYPDLPKGYQITQMTKPVGIHGYVDIDVNDEIKRVTIQDIHLEEDTASLDHYDTYSLIDYNRAGVPLIETVTDPCMHSKEEALTFLETLRSLIIYCGVSEARSDRGQMRCDVNISLSDSDKLGNKVEIKNINSFYNVGRAIDFEIERQTEILKSGGAIISEYPLGEKPQRQNFPERNRIVSGMSKGIIVVEAKEKSGTLITVDFALDQGRDVFVVPGNINQETSKGTNELIKQGAKLITNYKEVVEEYQREIKMNYYLDFDYTLFDTHAFRQGLYQILEKNGLDKTYLALTPELETSGQKLLNIKELFKNLSETKKIPLNNFLEPLEELYSRCDEFVYEDSVEFIKYLKSKNHKLYVVTWGEKEFQKEKLQASKLYNYFDEIVYAEQLKYELDLDYKNGIFVDDSIRDLEGLYNKQAKQVFRIKRPNGKNSDKELNIKEILEFNSLKQLQEYLEKQD